MSTLTVSQNLYEYTDSSGQLQTIQLGNLYSIEGVDGVNGDGVLSIGQAVMAISLARATELEEELISLMEELEANSEKLQALSDLESLLVEWESSATSSSTLTGDETDYQITYNGTTYNWDDFLVSMGLLSSTSSSYSLSDIESIVTDMESQMDELNSFSQDTMIDIQSVTSKRDQSYDTISNILKSLNTTMTGNANNI